MAAGVAALMMSASPSLDNLAVESLLYSTSVDRGAAGRDPYFGYGRVNAAAALQAAVARNVKADTQAPLAAVAAPLSGATVSGLVAVDVSATDNVDVIRADLKASRSPPPRARCGRQSMPSMIADISSIVRAPL